MKGAFTFIMTMTLLSAYVVSAAWWWPPQEPEIVCNQPALGVVTDWQHACLNSANWCNLLLHDRDFRRQTVEKTYEMGTALSAHKLGSMSIAV